MKLILSTILVLILGCISHAEDISSQNSLKSKSEISNIDSRSKSDQLRTYYQPTYAKPVYSYARPTYSYAKPVYNYAPKPVYPAPLPAPVPAPLLLPAAPALPLPALPLPALPLAPLPVLAPTLKLPLAGFGLGGLPLGGLGLGLGGKLPLGGLGLGGLPLGGLGLGGKLPLGGLGLGGLPLGGLGLGGKLPLGGLGLGGLPLGGLGLGGKLPLGGLGLGGLPLGGLGLGGKLPLGGLGLGGLPLGGLGLGGKLPLGGLGLGGLPLGGLGLGGKLPLGGLGLGGLPLGGLGSSLPLIINPVAGPLGSGKCASIGLLRAREVQLRDALQTTKRSCLGDSYHKNDDEDFEENFYDDDAELLERDMLPEIEDPIELALIDPTARVELNQNKRSGLCLNSRLIVRTLRILGRLLRFLFTTRRCPPIGHIPSYFRHEPQQEQQHQLKKRSMHNEQEYFDQGNLASSQHEDFFEHQSSFADPRFGSSGYSPFNSLGGPYNSYSSYGHQQMPIVPPPFPVMKPVKYQSPQKPIVVVQPVSKPYKGSSSGGRCNSYGYLKAREAQLEDAMETTMRASSCVLHNKVDDHSSPMSRYRSITEPDMSVSSVKELALIDPFSRVELFSEFVNGDGKRNMQSCSNPRILLKTLSILRRLLRFLFTTDHCPPIQHLTSWIMRKLDTRELFDAFTSPSSSSSSYGSYRQLQ